jgi:hypothetical protein
VSSSGEGDFHGLRTGILQNDHLRIEFTLDAGPRIVRFSTPRGRNVFAETPHAAWETVHGRPFRLLGGHRLWSSPECPLEEQPPDDAPVEVERQADAVALTGGTRTHEGLLRRIELRLSPDGPRAHVTHMLTNDRDRVFRVAAWALTQVASGGVAVLPLPDAGLDGEQLPNRNVVLWPYASLDDARLDLRDDAIRVASTSDDRPFKIGCLNRSGSVTYELGDVTFRKRFRVEPTAHHVDLGCNVEVYTRAAFLELETLTPLRDVAPGESIEHVEEWELLPR